MAHVQPVPVTFHAVDPGGSTPLTTIVAPVPPIAAGPRLVTASVIDEAVLAMRPGVSSTTSSEPGRVAASRVRVTLVVAAIEHSRGSGPRRR